MSPSATATALAFLLLAAGLISGPAAEPLSAQRAGGPPGAPPGPPPGRGGGPGPQPELAIVAQFDRDGDGRLDAAERAAARAWLAQARPGGAPGGGRGGRGGGGGGVGGRGGGGRGGLARAPASPGIRLTPAEVPPAPSGAALYDPSVLRTIFLTFENTTDWEQELAAFYNTDVEVPASVVVDGRSYADVGVGFRGASSFRMVPEGSKRSLKLRFDFVHDDQSLGEYRVLNLLNSNGDPTFLRTILYSQIARDYVPAPQVNFVRVVVNGENWGVYSSQQQYNKDFLRDFFGTTEGARWKVPGSPNGRGGMEYLGENPDAYRRLYEIRTKDDRARWADLIHLFRVLDQTPLDGLEAALEPILDIDGVLRFLALDVALVNSDGYWTRASDYYIYQDGGGRFHVIPHDMNEALGVGGMGGAGPQLDPLVGLSDPTKPLRSRLLAVPALRERYLAYVRDVAERWLDWETLGPLVERYQALIEEDVRRDTRKLYATEAFLTGADALKSFADQRRAYLLR